MRAISCLPHIFPKRLNVYIKDYRKVVDEGV
jgi:hypothetical protein